MGTARTPQVCQNGHIVVSALETAPELSAPFRTECSGATITKCPSCDPSIRGHYYVEGLMLSRDLSSCHACGKPCPWTAAKLETARALADELEGLSAAEREELKAALPDIDLAADETPFEQVAKEDKRELTRFD